MTSRDFSGGPISANRIMRQYHVAGTQNIVAAKEMIGLHADSGQIFGNRETAVLAIEMNS